MSALKLITEWSAWEYDKEKTLTEASTNGGKYIMRGILQKANTLNQTAGCILKIYSTVKYETIKSLLRRTEPLESSTIPTLL